jgi:hypothetical protein
MSNMNTQNTRIRVNIHVNMSNMNTNNRLFNLPTEIQRKIYEYDDTYKSIYNNVLDELIFYNCDDFMEYFDEVCINLPDDDDYMELKIAKIGLSVMYYDLHIIEEEEFDKLYKTLFKKIKSVAYDEFLEMEVLGYV